MRTLVLRVHIWLGLLGCTALITFGAAGLATAWRQRPWREPPPAQTRQVAFEAPQGTSERELAAGMLREIQIPLAREATESSLRYDAEGRPTLSVYTLNGNHRATLLADQGVVRVRSSRTSFAEFLNRLHSMTFRSASNIRDWRVRLWSIYVELSIWALMLMPLTGIYLWIATRPAHRWARASVVASVISAILFYFVLR